MNAKELVYKFFNSAGILSKSYCLEVMHEEVVMEWHSSKGFLTLDLQDILALSKDLRQSYFSLRAKVDQVVCEADIVSVRYSYFVRTLENPDEELILAAFIAIWELKDGKMFRGYQMSQLIN